MTNKSGNIFLNFFTKVFLIISKKSKGGETKKNGSKKKSIFIKTESYIGGLGLEHLIGNVLAGKRSAKYVGRVTIGIRIAPLIDDPAIRIQACGRSI